ncbi:poly(A)-specific ribonuclease [Ascosphaera atra]|nr:poly(A)-specific ribonuclease [Ascosphaera atra]
MSSHSQGRICSYYGVEGQRYTSVTAHPRNEGPVRQFLFHPSGVVSLTSKSVHLITRRGLTQWHLHTPDMEDLRCMAYTTNPNRIIVAGLQPVMLVIDLEKGTVLEKVNTQYYYNILRKSRYLLASTDRGYVNVISFADWRVVKTWRAHGTMISDMDTRNDLLVTCGYTLRPMGNAMAEPLAHVYDLKTLQQLQPIPFHAGAAFVRMHPKLQTTAFIASQTGQLQVVDLMNPTAINLRQANVSMLLGLETSSSGEALALSDAECMIHLWGSPTKIHFNELSKDIELADVTPRAPVVDWSPDTPLNIVGMPYYKDKLLSAWPSHLVFEVGKPPEKIDQAVLQYLKPSEIGHFAPNPRRKRRYQVEHNRANAGSEPALIAPRFLSEKARTAASGAPDVEAAAEAMAAAALSGETEEQDPLLKYSSVEIKYSRFGVDDFDFRFYNKTEYSGLETHIVNSFANALLQLLKFTPLLRNIALQHSASSCMHATCLLCEMGFLFDMLDKAQGENCQATNLLKTFSAYREAVNMGLMEENLSSKSLTATIQGVTRFFLKQIGQDFRNVQPTSDLLDQTLSTGTSESIRCMYCGKEHFRFNNPFITELAYPHIDPKQARRNPNCRFSNILRTSIETEQQSRGWCQNCRRYQQMAMRKTTHRLPSVLTINAGMLKHNARALWAIPGWLPDEIGMTIDNGRLHIFEGGELGARRRMNTPNLVEYELVGMVAQVDVPDHQKPHLVSFINVSISSRQADARNRWHLFNDFLVTEVQKNEALSFQQGWKTPCTLTYQIKRARHAIDDSWKEKLDTSLLFFEWSLNNKTTASSNQILATHENPTPGTPVALDTEFVDLEKAEIEVKADGTQEMLRPSRSGLARVSVIRGSGPNEGVPFIDDYITINDHIVDYVTQYSGIKPGDLDLRHSPHNLVPLKIAYKKLWILLNLGCVFVGHGLASDFRKINIKVPKKQTVDTQYLYFHPGKSRRLSLRYLAWAVFKEYIQEDPVPVTAQSTTTTTSTTSPNQPTPAAPAGATTSTTTTTTTSTSLMAEGHDSIEDARMALRLWKKFQEYSEKGIVGQILEDIFREGVRLGFKPAPRGGAAVTTATISPPKITAPVAMHAGNGGGNGGSAVGVPNGSGRNTPDFTAPPTNGPIVGSVPATPAQQGFRRDAPLTPSNGSFTGMNGRVSDVFAGPSK